jgi:hypothetical protein
VVASPLAGRLPLDSKKGDESSRRRSVSPRRGSVTSSTASARSRRARIFGCADSSVSQMATRCGPRLPTTSRSRCETSEANWRRPSRGPVPRPDESVRGGIQECGFVRYRVPDQGISASLHPPATRQNGHNYQTGPYRQSRWVVVDGGCQPAGSLAGDAPLHRRVSVTRPSDRLPSPDS